MQHHPDRVAAGEKAAAEEQFKQITEAYEVLRDPEKRAAYDRYGVAGPPRGARGGGVGLPHFALPRPLHLLLAGLRRAGWRPPRLHRRRPAAPVAPPGRDPAATP